MGGKLGPVSESVARLRMHVGVQRAEMEGWRDYGEGERKEGCSLQPLSARMGWFWAHLGSSRPSAETSSYKKIQRQERPVKVYVNVR